MILIEFFFKLFCSICQLLLNPFELRDNEVLIVLYHHSVSLYLNNVQCPFRFIIVFDLPLVLKLQAHELLFQF